MAPPPQGVSAAELAARSAEIATEVSLRSRSDKAYRHDAEHHLNQLMMDARMREEGSRASLARRIELEYDAQQHSNLLTAHPPERRRHRTPRRAASRI